jgi:hypothetical protein
MEISCDLFSCCSLFFYVLGEEGEDCKNKQPQYPRNRHVHLLSRCNRIQGRRRFLDELDVIYPGLLVPEELDITSKGRDIAFGFSCI